MKRPPGVGKSEKSRTFAKIFDENKEEQGRKTKKEDESVSVARGGWVIGR